MLCQLNNGSFPRLPLTPKGERQPTCDGVLPFRGVRGVSDGKHHFTVDLTLVLCQLNYGSFPRLPLTPKGERQPTCGGVLPFRGVRGVSDGKRHFIVDLTLAGNL